MEIYYVTNEGNKVYLDREPYYMLDSSNVVNYEWEYQTNSTKAKISGFTRYLKIKDVDIAIVSTSKEGHKADINNIVGKFENDIVTTSPGKLYMGDYYLSCYFVKSKKQSRYENVKKAIVNFSIIVEEDMWIKEEMFKFRYKEQPVDTSGRGYPYGYSYDYAAGGGYTSDIENTHFGYSDCVITIFGYANKPEVSIGGNTYKLNYTVQTGERAVIDTKQKTVQLSKKNGVVVNLFRYRDTSHYIFSKIKPGIQPVYWNGNFDFDVLMKMERSEPEWM